MFHCVGLFGEEARVCEEENPAAAVVDDLIKPKSLVPVISGSGESKRSKGTSVARAISIVIK
jgi:hypothetical protein